MALASGAMAISRGSTVNHIINGASLTNGSYSVAGDIDNAFSNADGYAFVDVALTHTRAAAGTAGLTVTLFRRFLDIVGTSDEPAASANFPGTVVGVFLSSNITTEQFEMVAGVPVYGRPCEFYIQNNTGQTINATWDLDIHPWTWIPAP